MSVTSSSNCCSNVVISLQPEGSVSGRTSTVMKYSSSLFAGVTLIDPCSWCVPQLLCLLHQTLLSAIVYYCLPVCPGVFLLVLLLSAGCCCLLRPATHAPLLFRRDTNLQTLLALRSNLSGQGISCPMCSGETAAGMEAVPPVDLRDPEWMSELHLVSCRCVHGEAAPIVHPHFLIVFQVFHTSADPGHDNRHCSSEFRKIEHQSNR